MHLQNRLGLTHIIAIRQTLSLLHRLTLLCIVDFYVSAEDQLRKIGIAYLAPLALQTTLKTLRAPFSSYEDLLDLHDQRHPLLERTSARVDLHLGHLCPDLVPFIPQMLGQIISQCLLRQKTI